MYQGIYHAIHDENGYYQSIIFRFLMRRCRYDIEEMVWEDWNGNGYGGTNYTIVGSILLIQYIYDRLKHLLNDSSGKSRAAELQTYSRHRERAEYLRGKKSPVKIQGNK
jgi:hypothetical protein